MCSIVSPMPVRRQQHHRDAARRSRSGARRPTARRPAGAAPTLAQSTSRPIRPPSQTEPEARCSQSKSSVSPRGEVCAACPAAPGTISTAAAADQRTTRRDQLGDRAMLALRTVEPQRDPCGDAEQREAQLEVDDRAAERGHAEQRHQRREVEHRAQRVVGGREVEIHGDRDQAQHRRDDERDRQRAQARPLARA